MRKNKTKKNNFKNLWTTGLIHFAQIYHTPNRRACFEHKSLNITSQALNQMKNCLSFDEFYHKTCLAQFYGIFVSQNNFEMIFLDLCSTFNENVAKNYDKRHLI